MSIFDPDGRRIFTTLTDGVMAKQGGTELFLESAEPSFKDLPLQQLLARWPAGRYEFRGVGLNSEKLKGSALLTHDLPDGPVLVSPIEGGEAQNPDHTVMRCARKQCRPRTEAPSSATRCSSSNRTLGSGRYPT